MRRGGGRLGQMPYTARPFVALEASLAQLRELAPNVAVLPWGATEAHNLHLPHGTDVIEGTKVSEAAVERANAVGARCILLPTVPFGNNNTQLNQVATITLRTRTQLAVLMDVAESLVRQKIDRLVILNFHGANEFKPLIRDVMLDLPIFIVQVQGFQLAPAAKSVISPAGKGGDHADEWETSVMLHLVPELVADLATAGDGAVTPSALPKLTGTPGVWASRHWPSLTRDTGAGDPRQATAEKGRHLFEATVEALVPVLVELSAAREGQFPFVIDRTGFGQT